VIGTGAKSTDVKVNEPAPSVTTEFNVAGQKIRRAEEKALSIALLCVANNVYLL
jgi:hypothetical protein